MYDLSTESIVFHSEHGFWCLRMDIIAAFGDCCSGREFFSPHIAIFAARDGVADSTNEENQAITSTLANRLGHCVVVVYLIVAICTGTHHCRNRVNAAYCQHMAAGNSGFGAARVDVDAL